MTAKEMFEELGFNEYCSKQGQWVRYRHIIKERNCGSDFIDIIFSLQNKSFVVKNQNQKEELGWKQWK